jgi:hypothetical protein
LEFLTAVAFLIIVMGLMVSLARYVRTTSADQLTRTILLDLEKSLREYVANHKTAPLAPDVPPQIDELPLTAALQQANRTFAAALAGSGRPGLIGRSPEEAVVRDAWGQPIGYLAAQHPLLGMAPQNRPFFFSAGPDGRYLTRQDNLYSYEQTEIQAAPSALSLLDTANNTPAAAPRGPGE